jgi:hypothetical protein
MTHTPAHVHDVLGREDPRYQYKGWLGNIRMLHIAMVEGIITLDHGRIHSSGDSPHTGLLSSSLLPILPHTHQNALFSILAVDSV